MVVLKQIWDEVGLLILSRLYDEDDQRREYDFDLGRGSIPA